MSQPAGSEAQRQNYSGVQDQERAAPPKEHGSDVLSGLEEEDEADETDDVQKGKRKHVSLLLCHWHRREDPSQAWMAENRGTQERKRTCTCVGIGLVYALMASLLFSVIALLAKKIEGVHAVEISAIRCFFQMLFVLPALIYYKIGFLGPRNQRIFLFLRGFLGAGAMILFFYAVQQMPLADSTVIVFSNPVFTVVLAWIFLKEKCTIWDFIFIIFTLAGVVLIARPPFLFGSHAAGMDGEYTNHIKGTVASFLGAVCVASTFVVLRKMGMSVHYYLSVWYYAVVGFIQCMIVLVIIQDWSLPFCGIDRWLLILIGLLGVCGQTLITKALQHEKAGPVALVRTVDVVFAFILQFIFLNQSPTWWSLGGALCVIGSTSGVALRKWVQSIRKR
ncbi:solute carrier family 35 member G1 isoform X2 [Erpetoichthys calabaricus]|uniref:solute carrier family 35 member G1 isoform X2 n=1 Tax=Erpetoichthys calabaricus TaxID=27687 RepID=UPI00223462BD|nr:solute carrier family 35 member G1 isoform X2 [Erpetoichthys calabaricus]